MCKIMNRKIAKAAKRDSGCENIVGIPSEVKRQTGCLHIHGRGHRHSNEEVTEKQLEDLTRPLRDINSLHLPSKGSALHPHGCTACRFHCYSFDMKCNKGWDCEFCHIIEEHPSNRKDLKMKMIARIARRDPAINTV